MDERYGDPERIVVDALEPLIAAFPAPYDAATVGVGLPGDWTVERPPHIGVFCDHIDPAHPVTVLCLMRLTCWAGSPTKAKQLGRLTEKALLRVAGDSVWAVRPGSGPIGGTDPDNKAPLSTFTVTVELQPNDETPDGDEADEPVDD